MSGVACAFVVDGVICLGNSLNQRDLCLLIGVMYDSCFDDILEGLCVSKVRVQCTLKSHLAYAVSFENFCELLNSCSYSFSMCDLFVVLWFHILRVNSVSVSSGRVETWKCVLLLSCRKNH